MKVKTKLRIKSSLGSLLWELNLEKSKEFGFSSYRLKNDNMGVKRDVAPKQLSVFVSFKSSLPSIYFEVVFNRLMTGNLNIFTANIKNCEVRANNFLGQFLQFLFGIEVIISVLAAKLVCGLIINWNTNLD